MLNHWGYRYFVIGTAIACTEVDLINYRRAVNALENPGLTIEYNNPIIKNLKERFDDVRKFGDDQDLGTILQNIRRVIVKIYAAGPSINPKPLYVDQLLEDVTRIKNDFFYVLSGRSFYSISPEVLKYYGQPELFGPAVARKFKAARDDIERAGNCLALGESTACVLHLLRAMETALRRLAQRLHVPINPKDTWGMILKNLDQGIQALPEKNEQQKKKKSQWAECRTNLFHVKLAWRDDSMHGKVAYNAKQARNIMDRVESFMQHLATL